MSMYAPRRNYQSRTSTDTAARSSSQADCNTKNTSKSADFKPRAQNANSAFGEAATTSDRYRYSHSYSHSGMLRGRNPLDHSIFAQQAESTEHCEHHQSQLATSASVPASGTNHHSIRNVMPLTALNRPRQESVGISESRPSSLSSANDRAAIAKTPTFEYYGFVIYLVSLVSFVLYLMWAYLPDSVLGAVGITYYPDRYWALALPAWWLTVVAFAYLFNMAANMYNTPLLNSMDNIVDPYSNLPKNMAKAAEFYSNEVGGIPPVSDIPISLVNKCLYEEDAEPL